MRKRERERYLGRVSGGPSKPTFVHVCVIERLRGREAMALFVRRPVRVVGRYC